MINLEIAQNFFALARVRFTEKSDELNALDAAIGDGDHGATMLRAFTAAEKTTRQEFTALGALFDSAAQALAENAGGAIGPLLASFFAEGGVAFAGMSSAGSEDFLKFLSGGLAAVQEIGSAQPGDKTLVDALVPALQAFSTAQADNLLDALRVSSAAAAAGADSTREIPAKYGRARFLGERSLGHPDPGATSMAILLQLFHDAVAGDSVGSSVREEVEFEPPPGKFINHPDRLVPEDNEGLALATPQLVRLTDDGILLRAAPKGSGKVGLAIGHGGGHTPSMGGLIGPGLLDADVYGPLFTCASGIRIAKAIAHADRGAGVALLVSNHSGDVLNARLGIRRARQLGTLVEPILLGDDIATAPRERFHERRGLGGLLFALKIGGAAAEAGQNLDEIVRVMKKTNERTATLAVAVRAPTHPVTGQPLFDLPEGQIEVGIGVHGEVGVYRGPHMPADELVDLLVARLVADLEGFQERQMLVFVNGTGGTSQTELHILYRRAHHNLSERGYKIVGSVVSSLFTTQEMGGFSLSLGIVDSEMRAHWQAPAYSPSFFRH